MENGCHFLYLMLPFIGKAGLHTIAVTITTLSMGSFNFINNNDDLSPTLVGSFTLMLSQLSEVVFTILFFSSCAED